MPELPEVEMVVRGLCPDVIGRTFTNAVINWERQIAPLSVKAFSERITGQRVEQLSRRGKYVVFTLSSGALLVHLKMTGRLYVSLPDQQDHADRWVRAIVGMDDGRELRFSDLRKFGRLYLVKHAEEVTGNLGPEPLSEAFTLERFQELIGHRKGMIKPLLMNQEFIAGIGNIYADESLWLAGIAPRRGADTLKPGQIEKLYHAIRQVLQQGIENEGASINWYRKPDGSTGSYQERFYVYDRTGQSCPRCGDAIQKTRIAQRGTHFCPSCQV
ncbi:MAG: bifunctional DNA-formamidopyrimidine glycosylase/DNA-(apurinic or apyrimidinic site) lyase [Anaerolineae bacterium]|nr:bifunctional DNA-formamidopyrimidine glycosylase/DNA-(apurinic or apyrimidinic site) lyase [Anaerolineae bacterium]